MKKFLTILAATMILESCACNHTKSVEAAPACQCDTCACVDTVVAADTVVLK